VETVQKFNQLKPFAISIVDTFGNIKRKHFLRLVYLADNNMDKDIALGYHGHNNPLKDKNVILKQSIRLRPFWKRHLPGPRWIVLNGTSSAR